MNSPRKRFSPRHDSSSPSRCGGTPKKKYSPPKVCRSPNKLASPKQNLANGRNSKKTPVTIKMHDFEKQKEGTLSLPEVSDYDPVHFIRCHFGDPEAKKRKYSDNDPRDEFTKVWKCAFEPHPREKGRQTGIVATCGGETVCLIDCSTGKVMKRFVQQQQQFYTLAWTTLLIKSTFDGQTVERQTNILAAGGYNAYIYLINPDQYLAYKHWGGVPNKCVNYGTYYSTDLKFHPEIPTWLFSGTSDETVTLWDIGIPQGPDHKTDVRNLMVFTCDHSILNLVISLQTGHLVAGCDQDIAVWTLPKNKDTFKQPNHKRRICAKFVLPVPGAEVDGLTQISKDIVASKCVEDGCIYVWSLTQALSKVHNSKAVIVPLMRLEWKWTNERYIQLTSTNGKLLCGDDEGNIWIYNLAPFLTKKSLKASNGLYRPSRILLWPDCEVNTKNDFDSQMVDVLDKPIPLIVNDACLSSNGQFLVAATDSNLLCVWKVVEK